MANGFSPVVGEVRVKKSAGLLEGAGELETVIVTDWLPEPPVPVQVSVNVELVIRLLVVCEPEVAFVPDHSPEAEHEVALVLLQVSVAELPEVIEFGLADINTVGVVGGGVVVIPGVVVAATDDCPEIFPAVS
jgi:hypothetical protein